MMEQIRTGAYVIRNKHARTVLHLVAPGLSEHEITSDVIAQPQDENEYHDQQIWWIEPLPDEETAGAEAPGGSYFYTITNPCSMKALKMTGTPGVAQLTGDKVLAAMQHGGPSTWWKFRRAGGDGDGAYYHITSGFNGDILGVVGATQQCHGRSYVLGSDFNCWELVIPVVAVPGGWFHIENAGSGHLLSHVYQSNPPILVPPPVTPRPSQYYEDWRFQWALYSPFFWLPTFPVRNSWVLVNRCTRAVLINLPWEIEGMLLGKVTAWALLKGVTMDTTWQLALDPASNWMIINNYSETFLEQMPVPIGYGTKVICERDNFRVRGKRMSWRFRPAVLETHEGAGGAAGL